MTDERMGDALWAALRRLPPGSGIVLRHHAASAKDRRSLALRIRRIARARQLTLIVAGDVPLDADGVHGTARTAGLRTWPVHTRSEAFAGVRAKADALFVSPLFPTRSHPGEPAIGPARAIRIGRGLNIPLIALGGMDARKWRNIRRLGFHGWAAIDAWLQNPIKVPLDRRQNRNAVPT